MNKSRLVISFVFLIGVITTGCGKNEAKIAVENYIENNTVDIEYNISNTINSKDSAYREMIILAAWEETIARDIIEKYGYLRYASGDRIDSLKEAVDLPKEYIDKYENLLIQKRDDLNQTKDEVIKDTLADIIDMSGDKSLLEQKSYILEHYDADDLDILVYTLEEDDDPDLDFYYKCCEESAYLLSTEIMYYYYPEKLVSLCKSFIKDNKNYSSSSLKRNNWIKSILNNLGEDDSWVSKLDTSGNSSSTKLYGYDESDPYLKAQDTDGDGKISEEQWNKAFENMVDDLSDGM